MWKKKDFEAYSHEGEIQIENFKGYKFQRIKISKDKNFKISKVENFKYWKFEISIL